MYTQVPLIIELDIIYANHAIITSFVNDKEIVSNTNIFMPTDEYIGGIVSIHIRPIRWNHNGYGCEEAYTFHQRIEKLPYMPIVEKYRGHWTAQ